MGSKRLRVPSAELRQILADNIRAYRKSRDISQERFAEMCSLHRTYVGSLERGERNATLSTLEILAAALGTDVPKLLTRKAFEDGD